MLSPRNWRPRAPRPVLVFLGPPECGWFPVHVLQRLWDSRERIRSAHIFLLLLFPCLTEIFHSSSTGSVLRTAMSSASLVATISHVIAFHWLLDLTRGFIPQSFARCRAVTIYSAPPSWIATPLPAGTIFPSWKHPSQRTGINTLEVGHFTTVFSLPTLG